MLTSEIGVGSMGTISYHTEPSVNAWYPSGTRWMCMAGWIQTPISDVMQPLSLRLGYLSVVGLCKDLLAIFSDTPRVFQPLSE